MTLNEYIESIKEKRIAVIGIGVSNQPLIQLLLEHGVAVTACDKKDREALGVVPRACGLERHPDTDREGFGDCPYPQHPSGCDHKCDNEERPVRWQ